MENEEKNVFDELATEEFTQQEENVLAPPINEEQEMLPDDFAQFTYLKNPEVGASIELEVSKILKKPGRTLKNKATGKEFSTGLFNKKDNTRTETILETTNGERFTIGSWGLFFNLFGKDTEFQSMAKKNGSYKGIKIKITHVINGKDCQFTTEELMKLRGFATLEDAEAHKKDVAARVKNGTVYSVEILK